MDGYEIIRIDWNGVEFVRERDGHIYEGGDLCLNGSFASNEAEVRMMIAGWKQGRKQGEDAGRIKTQHAIAAALGLQPHVFQNEKG